MYFNFFYVTTLCFKTLTYYYFINVFQLGMVTLSLFRTILEFHCEDVMYQLIFRHLSPLHHLESQERSKFCGFSPKLDLSEKVHQSSPEVRDDTPHFSPYELAPDLVQSGDRLLALATLSSLSERHASHGGFTCAPTLESVCVEPKYKRHFRSHLPHDDRISVNGSLGSPLSQNTHRLHPYIDAAAFRIRQHRNACRSWSSMFSDFFQPDERKCLSDKQLLEYELLTLSEPQISHSKHAFFPHQNTTRSHCSSLEECNEPRFSARTHSKLTSLYQLNYFNDIYDDDFSGNLEKEGPLVVAADSSSNLPIFTSSTPSRGFSPTGMYAELREYEIQLCSCSSSILTSNFNDIFGNLHTTLFSAEELDPFLFMLDSVDSPWNCQVHFAHLPSPFSWPPIDHEFIGEINSYLLIPFERVHTAIGDQSPPEILQTTELLPRTLPTRIIESPIHSPAKPIAGGIGKFQFIIFY
ncbi:uncharacterized protein DEA37_0009563 [Paragonimus westermani]|uniref:Uncharacterized protein n=1 Tax=Paragonimus westermani TaxID=34504 RepID=A0A5J4NV48_9TREM|nr:uncharacterized protein DEA37_0009563 [Paragonimus westermani]